MNTVGSLVSITTISGSLSTINKIEGQIDIPDKIGDGFQFYEGDYIVEPNFNKQILQTKEKIMDRDIEINPIAISTTLNNSGGNTIYIGGIKINA